MDTIPMEVIPHGGARNISPDIGRLFLLQIEMFTLRTASEIELVADRRDAIMAAMPDDQKEKARVILAALTNAFGG